MLPQHYKICFRQERELVVDSPTIPSSFLARDGIIAGLRDTARCVPGRGEIYWIARPCILLSQRKTHFVGRATLQDQSQPERELVRSAAL